MKRSAFFVILVLIALGVFSSALVIRAPRSHLAPQANKNLQGSRELVATLSAPLDLTSLTNQAEVIVVGRIVDLSLAPQQPSTVNRSYLASFQITRTLKGSVEKSGITVKLTRERNRVSIAKRITPSLYAMFFLNRDAPNVYVLADRDVEAVVASEGLPSSNGDVLDQVVNEVSRVIVSSNETPQDQFAAVVALASVDTPAANEALRQALTIKDQNIRLEAEVGLLKHNDVAVLGDVEGSLMKSPPETSDNRILRLSSGIRDGIRNPKAIPILARLLLAKDPRVRRGAAHALRQTHVEAAVEPLSTALDDNDQMVRYDAVVGLAEIRDDLAHAPSVDTFKRNEQAYITYWKQRVNKL